MGGGGSGGGGGGWVSDIAVVYGGMVMVGNMDMGLLPYEPYSENMQH